MKQCLAFFVGLIVLGPALFAAVDTKDGLAITTATTIDGVVAGTADGQTISGGGGGCLPWEDHDQQIDNEFYQITSANNPCQKVQNAAGTVEICEAQIRVQFAGSDCAFHLEIWSDAAKAGTQYGSDSNSYTVVGGDVTAGWKTFTFATNPEPPGDFFIHVVVEDANLFNWRMGYNDATGSNYLDTDYAAYLSGAVTNSGKDDRCFILSIIQ